MKVPVNISDRHHTPSLFSKQIRWLLWRGPALPLMAERNGTWLAGLCWILAEGIWRWVVLSRALPPSAVSLVMIGDIGCPAHHVVVCLQVKNNSGQVQDWYVDANGVSTKERLLRYWQDKEGLEKPFLAPHDEQLLLDLGIPQDGQLSTRLSDCFLDAFGRFSPTFLR